jgi:hypothetical protein
MGTTKIYKGFRLRLMIEHGSIWLSVRVLLSAMRVRYELIVEEASLARASHEEMDLGLEDPEHSVAVADEKGGYMISLGVFHELHCLVRFFIGSEKEAKNTNTIKRRLKLYLHKEHYYPHLDHGSAEDTYELHHLSKHDL